MSSSNSMQSTTQTPLRFALLGSQRTSKTNIFSIISNEKSPVTYYPTNQNSTILFQFLAKHYRSRALLDILANLDDFESYHLLELAGDIVTSSKIKASVNEQQILYQKFQQESQSQDHNNTNNNNSQDIPFSLEMKKKSSSSKKYLSPSSPTTSSSGSALSHTLHHHNQQHSQHIHPRTTSHGTNGKRLHHPNVNILSQTLSYYNLDYKNTDVFEDDESTTDLMSAPYSGGSFLSRRVGSNQNSFIGSPSSQKHLSPFFKSPRMNTMNSIPISISSDHSFGTDSNVSLSPTVSSSNINADPFLNPDYRPPVTTPILVELIDTPGTSTEELIPFLESSVDAKLAKDVLRNLDNDVGVSGRQRVTPLLNGSGLNDLNSNIDGYFLCYSSIPDAGGDPEPPSYDFDDDINNNNNNNNINDNTPTPSMSKRNSLIDLKTSESLETVKMIRYTIAEAWKEYMEFNERWENGKEFDMFSINQAFKSLWKKQRAPDMTPSSSQQSSSKESISNSHIPPMIVVCTNTDHNLASPILIEQGRKLAKEWDCGFIEVCCEFENWSNVEEMMSLMIRESIEFKKSRLKSKVKKFASK